MEYQWDIIQVCRDLIRAKNNEHKGSPRKKGIQRKNPQGKRAVSTNSNDHQVVGLCHCGKHLKQPENNMNSIIPLH